MGSTAIEAIAEYHNDVDRSLRLYFSEASPSFNTRFFGFRPEEIRKQLNERLEETDQRSAFVILTRLEAAFFTDYECRCKKKIKDGGLSKAFRAIPRSRNARVRLNDILDAWKESKPGLRRQLSDLRGAFDFRNWFAHRRYTEPKPGGKYDFDSFYGLADSVLSTFPLRKFD
jgi:hypothetical protein